MKKIIMFLFVIMVLLSSQAFSQTTQTTVPAQSTRQTTVDTTQTTQVITPPPTEVVEDNKEVLLLDDKKAREVKRGSSEFNRMNKNYTITTQVVGAGPVSGQGVGLAYGQFLDRNSLVLFEWVKNNSTKQDLGKNETLTNFSVGAHFKKYARDFYYWRMGADYRFADYDFTSTTSRSFKADSFNVSISAGVQWYWESFTAGVDAVGASVPLFSNIRKEDTGVFAGNSLDDEKKKYATDTTWIIGRVYLGVAF